MDQYQYIRYLTPLDLKKNTKTKKISLNCGTLKVCEKKNVHRKWIDTISKILKKHSSVPIQKLAKKSVDNFKVVIILFKDNFCTGLSRSWNIPSTSILSFGCRARSSNPLFFAHIFLGSFFYWAILCFGTIVDLGPLLNPKEQKSRDVVSFWEEVSDRQKKRELGNTLFSMHFEGFSELVQNRNNLIQLDDSDDSHTEDDDKIHDSNDSHARDDDSEESTEEKYYAYIIDLDNISEQTKPAFCSNDAWKNIISSSNISTNLPSSVEKQIDNYLKDISIKQIRESIDSYKTDDNEEEKYTHKVFDHLGEISSSSSATRRNFNLSEGKRRRIGSKSDCVGSIVNADDKEIPIFELSGAPGDKIKLDRCMVDALNNLLEEYKTCEFTLAKEFKLVVDFIAEEHCPNLRYQQ
ncbi:16187_t:CDS:2, partial [Acaulospora morrowiae]